MSRDINKYIYIHIPVFLGSLWVSRIAGAGARGRSR